MFYQQLEIVFPVKPTIYEVIEKRERRLAQRYARGSSKKRKSIPNPTKDQVRHRDDNHCVFCDERLIMNHIDAHRRLTFDHFKPWSDGGNNSIQNIVLACERCNQVKDNLNFPDMLSARTAIRIMVGLQPNTNR